jgi:hypothetical protein
MRVVRASGGISEVREVGMKGIFGLKLGGGAEGSGEEIAAEVIG